MARTAHTALRPWLDTLRNRHTAAFDAQALEDSAVERRQQLDSVLLESLRPFILGSGSMVVLGGCYLGFVMQSLLGLVGVALGLAIGAAFLKTYTLVRAGRVPDRLAHPLAASISIVGFTLLIFSLLVDRNSPGDLRFMGLALTVFMASALYLVWRWLIGMMIFMIATWITINIAIGYQFIWERHAAGFIFIAITTLVGYAVRKRAIVRMIETRQENNLQNAQLIEALERAHRSEAELHVERYLADQIVDSMGQGLVLLDAAGLIEYVNPAAEEIFGESVETLTGAAFSDFFQTPQGDEQVLRIVDDAMPGETDDAYEVIITQASGQVSSVLVSATNRDHGGTILTLTDLTVRKQFEAQLERLAHYDALTGLANRPRFINRLQELARELRQRPAQLAVLFLDLDRFKQINDTLGHAIGDEVLVECAHRIQSCIRARDIAARFGGDEFVMLLVDIDDERTAVEIAERIVERIEEPFFLAGQIQSLSGSVGISIGTSPDIDPDELIRQADAAMYEAKRGRSISTVVHQPLLRARVPQVA